MWAVVFSVNVMVRVPPFLPCLAHGRLELALPKDVRCNSMLQMCTLITCVVLPRPVHITGVRRARVNAEP